MDSFVCWATCWQAKTHSKVGINERQRRIEDSAPIQCSVVLVLKYALTNSASSLRRLPFHADLLSLSNVWYAGTRALLNDLISIGLPSHWSLFVREFVCLQALPLDKARDLTGQTDSDTD